MCGPEQRTSARRAARKELKRRLRHRLPGRLFIDSFRIAILTAYTRKNQSYLRSQFQDGLPEGHGSSPAKTPLGGFFST